MSSSMKVGLAVGGIVLLGVITWIVLNGEEDRPQIRVKSGSVTFEDHLVELVTSGALELDEARSRAVHRDEFDDSLRAAQLRRK